MSFQLFKQEILGRIGKQHESRTKTSKIIADAYVNLIMRHFETISGGGQFMTIQSKKQILARGIQNNFEMNIKSDRRINVWDQLAPHIYSAWTGNQCIGPTGMVMITGTGVFKGPPIPENDDPKIWLEVFCGVIAVHLTTLIGTYTNFVTGVTIPWSGVLLKTFP